MLAGMQGLALALVVACGCGRIGFGDEPCELPATGCAVGIAFECGTSCYVTCRETRLTWDAALEYCRAWGGELVTIDSADENACVAAQIPETTAWSGLHEPVAGTWVWSSGSPAPYRFWEVTQPDGLGYFGGTVAVDCARINNDSDNSWLDEPCGDDYHFLCER
jgi:hypothetical protein